MSELGGWGGGAVCWSVLNGARCMRWLMGARAAALLP